MPLNCFGPVKFACRGLRTVPLPFRGAGVGGFDLTMVGTGLTGEGDAALAALGIGWSLAFFGGIGTGLATTGFSEVLCWPFCVSCRGLPTSLAAAMVFFGGREGTLSKSKVVDLEKS